jgi:hypothetical protein
MFVKYLHYLGIIACITLIVSCFLPWGFYADINQEFTGFYSYKNQYGRPGKLMTIMAVMMLIFMLLPKIWAKRTNLFLGALLVAYAVKSYVLYSSCYNNYCPEKKFGLYLMLGCTVIMLIASIFPNMRLVEKKAQV